MADNASLKRAFEDERQRSFIMGPRKKTNLDVTRKRVRKVREKKKAMMLVAKSPRRKRKSFITPLKSPASKVSPMKKRMKVSSARPLFSEVETGHSMDDCFKEISTEEFLHTEDKSLSENEQEMMQLVPQVMRILKKEKGLDAIMLKFFRQVKEEKFPLNNIAFLLWTEVIKWYENSTTATMRYSSETKLFWKLGWRIFGGRFLYFMGGYKNYGDIVLNETSHGAHKPGMSEINFAVPDQKILRKYSPYLDVGERKPGIYTDVIQALSSNVVRRSCCLTFDGKKLKQGLTVDSGDVDLLGFEPEASMNEKQCEIQNELEESKSICAELISLELNDVNVTQLPISSKEIVQTFLLMQLRKISQKIFSAREIRKRKEYCRMKLIERGGNTDWRKGKYVYAISAITAFIYDIDEFLQDAVNVTDCISKYICLLQNSLFVAGETINLSTSQMYVDIDSSIDINGETRLIKQQSKEWFDLRKKAKVTGSTIYAAIGCDGLNNMKRHFDRVVCGVPDKTPSDEVKGYMEHGRKNEINAAATVVGKVLPVLCPDLIFFEEGCATMKVGDRDMLIVISPDGSLRENMSLNSTKKAIEIKCPVKKVHTEFPCRYLLQCLFEIEALNVSSLLYVSWTENETVVFEVHRDNQLFVRAKDIALSIYGVANPKKPTKLTKEQKKIKDEIVSKSKNVKVVGRFSSLRKGNEDTQFDTDTISVDQLIELLEHMRETSRTFFELNRQRATEAVVFLVADLDRSWEKERARSSPVAWFPKGYSLSTDIMRKIAEEVHNQCHSNGIHVPCQSFDGQWHKLVVRSVDDKPLTVFQLQKDVWKEVEHMKKATIIQELKKVNKDVRNEMISKDEPITRGMPCRVLVLSNGGSRLPVYRTVPKDSRKQTPNTELDVIPQATLVDVVPDVVRLSGKICDSILSIEPVDGKHELEALNVNVDDDHWARELEDMQNEDETNTSLQPDDIIYNLETAMPINVEVANRNTLYIGLGDAATILSLLRTTPNCNKQNKWDRVTVNEFILNFSSQNHLSNLLDVDLRVIIRYLKQTKNIKVAVKESSNKQAKIQELCDLLGLDYETTSSSKKSRTRKVKTLAEISVEILNKRVSKQELNIIYAEYIWHERYSTWKNQSAVRDNPKVDGSEYQWFYTPEYSMSRQQLEVRCIDATHLLTRTRRKSCRGGLDGQSNEAWVNVAKSRRTLLTPTMVEDITDPMSATMATTHFSSHVEMTMRTMGYSASADLCRDIRQWWESEDKPALPAADRIKMRLRVRDRLLKHVNFARFPPATSYVKGWPTQLWEAILASIDAKVLLYSLCHTGSYNARAFSSMIGETFFAELTLNDKRGQGTVTSKEFGQFVGNAMEQVQARLDPDRPFSYRTSRTTVYKLVEDAENLTDAHDNTCRICRDGTKTLPSDVIPRNHAFDDKERGRVKGTRKEATVDMNRNAIQKGSLGVRWESARRNDSKLLPTKRMGIDEKH